MNKIIEFIKSILYSLGILKDCIPDRYCPKCNAMMDVIGEDTFDPIVQKKCIAYQCPQCGSVLHSPINMDDEEDEDIDLGEL